MNWTRSRVISSTLPPRAGSSGAVRTQLEKLTISSADSQFIDSQRLGVEDIARIILGGFVELIGGSVSGGSLTYANREQRYGGLLALSLAPRYLVPFEAALSQLVPRDRYVKHNLDALMRADLKGPLRVVQTCRRSVRPDGRTDVDR